ncbi:MAG TPA: efflux RND transporter periplasmic adaptor subunit [Candidatus Acidoferrum sp.]|jgi:membrane fusion protein (multidrug efflux system)
MHARVEANKYVLVSSLLRAVAFVFPVAVLLVACGGKQSANPNAALPVSFVTAERKDVPLHGDWVGTVDGYVNAQIQPQVSGYLLQQTYKEGSQVRKDQILFEIDPRPFQAALDQALGQLAQAKGQLAQAQAQLELSEINVKRDTPLAARRAIAQSQLDSETQQASQNVALVETAKGQIASAEAAIETAKLNLNFTHVRSLIDGVAGQAMLQVGNLVSPQSVLTSVSQLDPIKVYFSIADSEYLALIEQAKAGGGDLLTGSANLPLTLTLSSGEAFPHAGHIVFVDRQMNQETGAIRIAASFPNPGRVLRPGQFGRVSAATQILHNAVLVPQTAVQELQGIQQVYTVGAGNKVHVVNVKLGAQSGEDWIIVSGLQEGAKVITDNLQKLKEGSEIAPRATVAPVVTSSGTAKPAGGS